MLSSVMLPYERPQVRTLIERLTEPPRTIVAVFGPRQSGKTTAVKQALHRIPWPSRYWTTEETDDPAIAEEIRSGELASALPARQPAPLDGQWITSRWEAARQDADEAVRRGAGGFVLVLDEIQNVPQWSSVVKGLWDRDRFEDRPLHVVILGSAPMRVQSGLTESLMGRFERVDFGHWSFQEMRAAFGFDLDTYLFHGGYPGAAPRVGQPGRWGEYIQYSVIQPSVERDVLAMTRITKPALLKRLFDMSARYSGQIVSYRKLQGHLQDAGNTTTLARYLDLLETAGLVTGLPKFAMAPHRRGFPPKLNVLNTALMTASSDYTFTEARADRAYWGRIVESGVGAHLFATRAHGLRLYYWREGDFEVDFVCKRGPRILGIEAKSGAFRRSRSGLDAFQRKFPGSRTMTVGEGGVPIVEFLSKPVESWLSEPWD